MHPDFSKLKAVQPASTDPNLPDFSHLKPIDPSGSADFGSASQSLSASKSGLAHSNTLLSSIGSMAKSVGNVEGNVMEGAAKNEGSIVKTVGGMGQSILDNTVGRVTNFLSGKGFTPTSENNAFNSSSPKGQEATQALKPQGVAENIGNTAANVGEFFIPGSAEETMFNKGSQAIENVPKALGLTGKAAEAVGGALKVALKSGITGLSTAGVTAAQGGTGGQVESSGVIGAAAGGIGQALETFGKGIAESLQKSDFKLSPAQEVKASAKADSASKFMTSNKILGSPEAKYSKLTSLNNSLESTLQASLPDDVSISKNSIIGNINATVESLKTSDPAIYKSARSDADEAISILNTQKNAGPTTKGILQLPSGAGKTWENSTPIPLAEPTLPKGFLPEVNPLNNFETTKPNIDFSMRNPIQGEPSIQEKNISVKDALNYKRSYGNAAFRQSKFSVTTPGVVSEGSYAVEQGFQKALSDTLDSNNSKINIPSSMSKMFGGKSSVTLPEFNKVYSDAINSKNLTGLARFKNDSGLVGRFFGLWAGESIGNTVMPGLGGKIVGGMAGEMASTQLPGLARRAGENIISGSNAIPGIAKTGLGIAEQPDQNQ